MLPRSWRAKSKRGKDAGSPDSFAYRGDRGRGRAPLCSRQEPGRHLLEGHNYSGSAISTSTRRPSRAALARTSVRSARAIRPWRPITLPTSSAATWSTRTSAPSRSSVSTRTASGSSTSSRARNASSSAISALDAGDLDQPRYGLGGLSALAEPVPDLRLVELDRRGLGLRVVAAHDLEEPSVARPTRIGGD